MKIKNLIIFSLLILTLVLGIYIILNKQKSSIISETTVTTKLDLCSNKYYETEYDSDGKIVIKDFPYYKIGEKEECKANEVMKTEEWSIQGKTIFYKWCYIKNLSFNHIKDLTCIQKLNIASTDLPTEINNIPIDNCVFEQEDFNNLSSLVNLEEITFLGCSNDSIDSGWWKNLKKLKKIGIWYSNDPDYDIFDNILAIIEKIPSVEYVEMYRGMGGITTYLDANKDKLCELIDNWKNVKTIYFPEEGFETTIGNGAFILKDTLNNGGQQQYSSCLQWIEGVKKMGNL